MILNIRKWGKYEPPIHFSSSSATSNKYIVQGFRYDGKTLPLKMIYLFLAISFPFINFCTFFFTSFAFTLQKKICLIHYWQLFETRHLKLFRNWSSNIEISLVIVYFFIYFLFLSEFYPCNIIKIHFETDNIKQKKSFWVLKSKGQFCKWAQFLFSRK